MTATPDNDETTPPAGGFDATHGPVLLIFAHPDDESFGCAGTLAALQQRNIPVTLVSATRGEAGEISNPTLANRDSLGAVREAELRDAMRMVGVHDVRFLGFHDSGMAGTPENELPRTLHQAPLGVVEPLVVTQIRSVQPATVITFGPEGIYGHPDHIRMHDVVLSALTAAAEPVAYPGIGAPWEVKALYYSAVPREQIQHWSRQQRSPFQQMTPDELNRVGTPQALITTVIDIAPYAELKKRVLAAHRTQMGEGGPYTDLPTDFFDRLLHVESFVRVPLPWDTTGQLPPDAIAALPHTTLPTL